jgi:NAD(P)-dependent dehydrogenase (short-subunit alcohol dehydrogenase family)
MSAPATEGQTTDRPVVLVTGAGAGIGQAIAIDCARAGAAVAVTSLDDKGAQTAARAEADGGTALWVPMDVTDQAAVDAGVQTIADHFGRIDGVVHNATSRRSSRLEPLEDATHESLADQIAVSLTGAYHCARAALPHLRRTRGCFMVMTSAAAMEGSAARPLYASMKAALRGLAKSLAVEWAPLGVRVLAVSPLAATPALASATGEDPALAERLAALVPLGRVGDPLEDIAPVVRFLLGDGARYVTGQTVVVDGGRYLL